jgi:hypothetical protein
MPESFLPSREGFVFVTSWPNQPAVTRYTPVGTVGVATPRTTRSRLGSRLSPVDGRITVQVYDPNHGPRDDIFITCGPDPQQGRRRSSTPSTSASRGFVPWSFGNRQSIPSARRNSSALISIQPKAEG